MPYLFILFFTIPILEMWVLLQVGSKIGALPTIGLVMLTAVIGAALLKHQGPRTLMRFQERLNSGEMPATEVIEGVALAIGGALLLTPGFFTDVVGFLCLVPFSRRAIAKWLIARGAVQIRANAFSAHSGGQTGFGREEGVIEGEFEREADPSKRNLP